MEKLKAGDLLIEIRKMQEVNIRRIRNMKYFNYIKRARGCVENGYIDLADAYIKKAKKLILGGL